jgi:hypothetical protein
LLPAPRWKRPAGTPPWLQREAAMSRSRNLQIVADRQAGESFAMIAKRYGLSRRRTAQIVQQHEQHLQKVSRHPVYQYLGIRAINCLRKDGVNPEDIDAISQYSRESLLCLPNFGHKSLAQLEAYLRLMGRALLGRGHYARAASIPPAAAKRSEKKFRSHPLASGLSPAGLAVLERVWPIFGAGR